MSAAAPQHHAFNKFTYDRSVSRGVTLLTLHGTLHHGFVGKKLAEGVGTKKVVLNLRDVLRFSSWGMSEWLDFQRICADTDIYLVECSTYVVSQLNLVTGLLGHAKLVSFYASYRCGGCSEEIATLFVVPRDRDTIRDLPGSNQVCPTCAGQAHLEEYPAAFFDAIANRAGFDVDTEVLDYLRGKFGYDLPVDLTRFRAHRRAKKGHAYMRFSGNLATLSPDPLVAATERSTAIDLEQVVFDPAGLEQWRAYVQKVTPQVDSLQLLQCTPRFLAHGVTREDLAGPVKVRTLVLDYECASCRTAIPMSLDVAENLEHLVTGVPPPVPCATCTQPMMAALELDEVDRLRALPARDRDPVLDELIHKARSEPAEKLEDCYALKKPAPSTSNRALRLGLALGTLVVAGLAAIAILLYQQKDRDEKPPVGGTMPNVVVSPETPAKPGFQRPEWVLSDVPSTAFCHDMINRLMCIGVSAYRGNRDEAVVEASDAALEELVMAVGLKINAPAFKDMVVPGYSATRSKATSALQEAESDRTSKAYDGALKVVDAARRRVVEALQASGGPAVPTQRSDWYWEEYNKKAGGTEFLVFVRYDVSMDGVKTLVERYSATTRALSSTVMTAFPGLGWQHPEFTGGALVVRPSGTLAAAGVTPGDVIMALGEHRTPDPAALNKRLDEWKKATGDLALTATQREGAARTIELKRRQVE